MKTWKRTYKLDNDENKPQRLHYELTETPAGYKTILVEIVRAQPTDENGPEWWNLKTYVTTDNNNTIERFNPQLARVETAAGVRMKIKDEYKLPATNENIDALLEAVALEIEKEATVY